MEAPLWEKWGVELEKSDGGRRREGLPPHLGHVVEAEENPGEWEAAQRREHPTHRGHPGAVLVADGDDGPHHLWHPRVPLRADEGPEAPEQVQPLLPPFPTESSQ